MESGKFFGLDGGDCSGKTEQAKLLVERIGRETGRPTGALSYPRYETLTGKVVKAYLDGAFGTPTKLDARQASMLYATDRWASFKEGDFACLKRGEHLVTNRYVTANMGHQGSKIDDPAERAAFFAWADDLEHVFYGIPRPDLNIILHVPAEVSMRLLASRGNVPDGHENIEHLRRAEATYLELAHTLPNCALIECVKDGELLSIPEVHELVWAEVSKVLALQPA
jgi:dTMP kinase